MVLTTAMKEEDVSDTSRNTSQGFPKAGKPKNSFKAYVFDDPEHIDDCSNCGVSHTTHTALDPQYWPLVLVEQLAQEQEREVRWDREGKLLKALDGASKARVEAEATDTNDEEDQDPLKWKRNIQSQPFKIEVQLTIKVENSFEEGMGEEKPKKKASGNQERKCYNCHKIGHIKRQCPGRLDGKSRNNRSVNRNKNRNKKSTKGNPQDRITRIEVVSNYEDYDYEGEADSDWYQGCD